MPFLKSGCSEIPVRIHVSSAQAAPSIVDWQGSLRPALSELSELSEL